MVDMRDNVLDLTHDALIETKKLKKARARSAARAIFSFLPIKEKTFRKRERLKPESSLSPDDTDLL